MKRFLMLALLLPLFAACGDDDPTEPQLNLNGTWRFSINNMTGAALGVNVTCNAGLVDFTLTTTGNTFSGIQAGVGRIVCTGGGQTLADSPIAGVTIVNGQINGSNVTFQLGAFNGQHTGTVSGTSMTGTAQWVLTSGNFSVTLNGQFTAAKI